MNVKDLETVLLFFYENRTSYHYFSDIKQYLKERSLTDLEIQAIIQKLVKDGYIIEEEQLHIVKASKDLTLKEQTKVWGWFISFDGIFLIDTLPLDFARQPYEYITNIEKKKKSEAAIENVPKKYWWIYNPIAFLLPLFIGYLIGEAGNSRSNKADQTRTQIVQPIPIIQDSSIKALPKLNNHKTEIDTFK